MRNRAAAAFFPVKRSENSALLRFEIWQAKDRRTTPAAFAMIGASSGYFGGAVGVVDGAGCSVAPLAGTPVVFTAIEGCWSPGAGAAIDPVFDLLAL